MKKNIVKNTSYLYAMNIVKIVFPLIILPYMTRVLSVAQYGVVSYVKAIMQYMQIFIDFGFGLSGTRDVALALAEKDGKLDYEIGNVFLARICLSSVALVAVCIMTVFMPILRANVLFTMLSFLAVFLSTFLMGYVFRGIEHMEAIALPFIIMKTISTALTFVFVRGDADILWIPILDVIGTGAAVLVAIAAFRKMKLHMKFSGLRAVWGKIKNSAIYFFSNMATTAFSALNTLLIGIYLQKFEIAYWSLCIQMIGAAQSLYTPITDGIYPHMVKTRDFSVAKKALKIFMPIVTAGCIFTLFVAKYALLILGGREYMDAALILRLLTVVLFFGFPDMLLGWPVLGAIGKQKDVTLTTIFAAAFQVLGLLFLILIHQFTLISIAIVRGLSEIALFAGRLICCCRYRKEFVKSA